MKFLRHFKFFRRLKAWQYMRALGAVTADPSQQVMELRQRLDQLIEANAQLAHQVHDFTYPKDGDCIRIVFDGAPGPNGPRFIDVEDSIGSIRAGKWHEREDGRWELRLGIGHLTTADCTRLWPAELTPALRDALGMMNFRTMPIAHALRAAGHPIPQKAEDEQAFVLHLFAGIALEHGSKWREVAAEKLKHLRDAVKESNTEEETPT